MSMLRTLLAQGYDGQITFLHYAHTPAHQIYADELSVIARDEPRVDVHLRYTRSGDQSFAAKQLAEIVPDFHDVDTFACGPAGLIAKVGDAFGGDGGSDKLRVEYFKTPTLTTGDAEGQVTFARSDRAAVNSGGTLLDQAEQAGLTPNYGCRMGICLSCTSRKASGTVRNVVTGAESSAPDEDIQICVSQPVGDCAVEL